MTAAKICGITTPGAVAAALEGGAAFIGFMFFPASPRNVSVAAAADLAAPARGRARVVAVTVNADEDLLDDIAARLRPDLLQLHGEESPARVMAAGARAGARTIKVITVARPEDLAAAAMFEDVADHLMFDARAPSGASRPGGLGAPFDWTVLAGVKPTRPWFLAGGLDPSNVAEAVAVSRAPIVDVSSGVERQPGIKDPDLIRAFLGAVRRA
ncbi:MAG TPA: phosphoribosylanthranilate isomerase [Caulobacteraceae bacterium]|nr:phosphoribosylanthranilate isomerase [Caulobacteraceae bacterium]